MKRSNIIGIIAAAVVIIVSVVLISWYLRRSTPTLIQGTVECTTYKASSKVPGRIDDMKVEQGDRVEKGQLLYTLSTPELEAKLRQAEAVKSAAAALDQAAIAGARIQQIEAAMNMWEKAQAGLELARKTYERVKNLYEQGVVPEQKMDEASANYKAMEFAGDGMKNLTMSDRIAICNLCVEAGAKTALMEVDDIALHYLHEHGREPKACFASDADAHFAAVYDIDLSTITPIVAKPHFVDNVCPAKEATGVKIDEAFLGSCNNGRIEDLRVGAELLKGRKVHPLVRFLVVPASQAVYQQALKEGLLKIFMEAGAIVMNPNCSVCWGSCQGVIGEGETLISTGTRNFKGRAGHRDSFVYLASAATVTASAIKGEIATADML